MPQHVIDALGGDWAKPEHPVTNGPYYVEAWAPGAKVVNLRRNRHFHDAARVAAERVDWLSGYDDATRLRLFRLGGADIASIEDASTLAIARRELGARLRSSPESVVGWIGINTQRSPLDDARRRRALSLAIDRRVLAERVRGLGETPSDAALPPGLPDHPTVSRPDCAPWPVPQRLAAARELMQSLRTPAGAWRRLTIGYPASSTLRKVFLAVSAMWKAIGADTEPRPLDGRADTAALPKGEFDVFSYSTFALVPPAGVFLDRCASDSPVNVCFYRSREYDALRQSAQRQLTTAARAREYARAESLLPRDLPVLTLFRGVSHRLAAARVRGWTDHPGHAHPSDFLALA